MQKSKSLKFKTPKSVQKTDLFKGSKKNQKSQKKLEKNDVYTSKFPKANIKERQLVKVRSEKVLENQNHRGFRSKNREK